MIFTEVFKLGAKTGGRSEFCLQNMLNIPASICNLKNVPTLIPQAPVTGEGKRRDGEGEKAERQAGRIAAFLTGSDHKSHHICRNQNM